jgi:tetratricopeptide (TPR) repeat protein
MKRMIAFVPSLLVFLLLFFPPARAADGPQFLLAAGRVDEAVELLERQIQNSPSAQAYNLLCRAHFELGEWEAGIPACEKAVSLEPTNGMYHLWLARIYGEKADHSSFLSAAGMAKKVRTEFERAVELDPDNAEARTDLAEFYLEAPGIVGGGKDKARAQSDEIARLNPGMACWVRARIAEKNKDLAGAEREYRAAIDATQGGAREWLNLAGFFRRTQRFDEMDESLRRLESARLDHPAALADGASIVLRTGRDYALGVRLVKRYLASETVEEEPVFKARYMLGELLEKQGDRAGAVEEYRAALAMAHNFKPAQEGLRRVAG